MIFRPKQNKTTTTTANEISHAGNTEIARGYVEECCVIVCHKCVTGLCRRKKDRVKLLCIINSNE